MNRDNLNHKEVRSPSSKAASPKFFYGYVVTAAGFMVWLVGWGVYTPAFGVLLVPMLNEFGWTRGDIMIGYALSTIVYGALAIVTGRLTDKLGPRVVIIVFGSFLGISFLLMSQVNALWQFQLNFGLVAAIGVSVVTVPVMATIVRWFVRQRGLMTGIVQAGIGIGGLVIAPLTAWLVLNYGWRLTYVILGVIALVCMIAAGLFFKSSPKDVGQLPDGKTEMATLRADRAEKQSSSTGLSLGEAIRTGRFWIIAGLYFSFGFCRSAFLPHTAAFVQDKGFSLTDGANVTAALAVSSLLGRIIMGRVADVIGNKPALIVSEVLTTIALALGILVTDLGGLYLYGIIFGFGWGAQAVLRFAVSSEAFGLASIGVVMGVLGLAEAIAASFGAYFAGYVFDVVGNYQPAFWLGTAISLLGIGLSNVKSAIRKEMG